MATYTMELRKIQAEFYNAMQSYPIFDESYREQLNDKIYHALKYREIGYETPELFLEELEEWMNLNMPEYNWLYKANLIELTPLQRAKLLQIYNGTSNSKENSVKTGNDRKVLNENQSTSNTNQTSLNETSGVNDNSNDSTTSTQNSTDKGTTKSTDNSKSYNSDFPQANLTDKDDSNYYTTGATNIDNSNGETQNTGSVNSESNNTRTSSSTSNRDSTSTSTDSGTLTKGGEETNNSTENYDMTGQKTDYNTIERTGNDGKTDFELLAEYRKSFLNVDAKLIRAIKKELFMNIW